MHKVKASYCEAMLDETPAQACTEQLLLRHDRMLTLGQLCDLQV
jgi:hypothetical protein